MMMSLSDEQREALLLALFDFQYVDFLYVREYILPNRSESHARNMISKWIKDGYIQSKSCKFINLEGKISTRVYSIGEIGRLVLLSLVEERQRVLDDEEVVPQHAVHQVMLAHAIARFQYIHNPRIKFFQGINEKWSWYQFDDTNANQVIRPDFQVVMRVYDNTLTRYVNIAFFIELERAKSRGSKNRGKLARYQEFLQKEGYPDGVGDIYDDTIHKYVVLFVVASNTNLERIKMIATEKSYTYYHGDKEMKIPVMVTNYDDVVNDITGKIATIAGIDEEVSLFGI